VKNQDDDMLTMPFGPDDQLREAYLRENGIGEKVERKGRGDILIRPGAMVGALYQLIHGSIDVIRDLGTAKETRVNYSRDENALGLDVSWTPILGGRYFFLKKASSLHYVVKAPSKLLVVTPKRIRTLYANRDCVKLVRELLRNSDMPADSFIHKELDARHGLTLYPGFCLEDRANLLGKESESVRGSDLEGCAETVSNMRKAYVDYACEMIYRLMGDDVEAGTGEMTNIAHHPPLPLR